MNNRLRIYSLTLSMLFGLLCGSKTPLASAQTPDPGAQGPFAVTREEYNFGDTAFAPTDFPGPVELIASVHYPSNLSGGPFPLIVFMHGRHATCFKGSGGQSIGSAFLEWPCSHDKQPIPSYIGYDYAAERLASHGYIVVSISANGIVAKDNEVSDFGALARAELIQRHLELWRTFNTTGGAPFGTRFVGKVDLSKVGTMGHSRAGEGVARHFLFNKAQGSPFGIKAVFPLAAVNAHRFALNNVALGVLLPYCDGDVSSLQGIHYYDDVRYNVPGDLAPKHYFLVMGANHNFYNSVWTPHSGFPGAGDDWKLFLSGASADPQCGNKKDSKRLTEAQQRGTAIAYLSAFFRAYVGGESQFIPILTGDAPPPPSAATTDLFVSFHAPDSPNLRRDVNRLLNDTNLFTNTLGGAVMQSGLMPYELCGGAAPQPADCLPGQDSARQPHTAPSRSSSLSGLSQLRTGWNGFNALYTNDLPPPLRNVSGFQAIQFRVSVNFADARNIANEAQDFSIVLTDTLGSVSSVRVSDFSKALFFPPGERGPVPKVVLNTVRIPLSAFVGVSLDKIKSVQFKFDQKLQGALLISDVAFASAPN